MSQYVPSKPGKYLPNVNIRLSPVSKFIMDVACDALIEGKNVVVEFPSSFSYFSLLIGNYYSILTKKSTLIFTKSKRILKLNDMYYQLMDDAIPFFIQVPIGIKIHGSIILKEKFVKKIQSDLKSRFIAGMQENLMDEERPLIVLVSEDEFIKDIEGSTIEIPKKYGKGLAIFENINVKDKLFVKKIIKWCESEKVQFIFLTNFASPNFYESIKTEENIVTIPFHNGLLDCSGSIQKTALNYYSGDYYLEYDSSVDLFNIDRDYNYRPRVDIDVNVIDNGNNFLSLLKDISVCISKLDEVDISLKIEILSLSKTAHEAVDSFSTIDYLVKYSAYSNRRINGIRMCNNIMAMSSGYGQYVRFLCSSIVGSFWSIRNNIEKCRSPIFDSGYERDNKFSRLFQLIDKYVEQYTTLFIVTGNEREIAHLNTVLNEHYSNLRDKLVVSSSGNIDERQAANGILILSGKLEYDKLSILRLPFKKKIVLVYANDNENIVCNLIDMYEKVSDYRKKLFVESLHNVNNEINISTDYYEKYKFLAHFEDDLLKNVDLETASVSECVESIQSELSKKYPVLSEYLKVKVSLDKFDEKLDTEAELKNEHDIFGQHNHYDILLENIETGKEEKITSGIGSEHTFIDRNSKLTEDVFSVDSEGLILIKVPGKSKSLLNMLIKLYNLDDHIDKTIVELWEDGLKSFENTSQSLNDLYAGYRENGGQKEKQTVRTWLNRNTLGPRDKKDIEIMGMVLAFEELINESDYIFKELEKIRNLKKSLGRHLSKIIAMSIGRGEILDDPFSATIWEDVKNYLFIVKKVTFVSCEKQSASNSRL